MFARGNGPLNQSNTRGRPRGILALEASHDRGSVAYCADDDAAPVEEMLPEGLVHGRELLPRVEALRLRVGFRRDEIGLVAVSAGPGSFTGTRIGVAAGKAIAHALGAGALSVSSLEVIAANVEGPGEIAVLLDARRGKAYGARFRRAADGALERLDADALVDPETFVASLPDATRLVGAGARTLLTDEVRARFEMTPEEHDTPRASRLAALARTRRGEFESGSVPVPIEVGSPHALIPAYLRRTAAEEAREGRA